MLETRREVAVCKTVGAAYASSNVAPATTYGKRPVSWDSRLCGPFSFVPWRVTLTLIQAVAASRPRCCAAVPLPGLADRHGGRPLI